MKISKSTSSSSSSSLLLEPPTSKKSRISNDSTIQSTSSSSIIHSSVADVASMQEFHLVESHITDYKKEFQNATPFPNLFVKNLLSKGFLENVRDELLLPTTNWNQKKNDLYDFYQSDSLTSSSITSSLTSTHCLVKLLYSRKFRDWIETITRISTTDMIDVSAAKYIRGSHLLCHDDNLSTRRIAYILYLTPENWTENDGGNLDLFCTESDSQSTPSHKIGKSITPVFNSIAFFEVSHKSFHQVAEVFSDIKGPRLSISGWFHGKTPLPPPQMPLIKGPTFYKCSKLFSTRRGSMKETYMPCTSVFNPLYTKQGVISQMKKSFTRDASLQLDGFLQPGTAKSFRSQFGSEKYDWVPIGPINQQSFRIMNLPLSHDSISNILSSQSITYPKTYSFQTFVFEQLLSETFYEFICNTTGLIFDQVSIQIRCFTHGDYTMLTDPHYKASTKKKKAEAVVKRALEAVEKLNTLEIQKDLYNEEEDRDFIDNKSSFVEVNLCLATPPDYTSTNETSEWPEEAGGYVSYMTEDDQLLCVPPKENSLSLVLKEPGVMSFVKFVTSDAPGPRYDINFLFRVKS